MNLYENVNTIFQNTFISLTNLISILMNLSDQSHHNHHRLGRYADNRKGHKTVCTHFDKSWGTGTLNIVVYIRRIIRSRLLDKLEHGRKSIQPSGRFNIVIIRKSLWICMAILQSRVRKSKEKNA